MKKVFGLSIMLLIIVALNSCSTNGSANSNNSNSNWNGKLSKIVIQSSAGPGSYSINFFYDNNGRLIRYYTAEGGLMIESWTFTRNADGKIVGETFINTSQNYSENTSYNLNANGQYISSLMIPSNANASRDSVVYYYNGNKIEQTYTYTSYRYGAWSYYKKDRYTFDNNDNIIKTEVMDNLSNQWTVSNNYSYDSNLPALESDDDNLNSILCTHNNVLNQASVSYNFTYTYSYGSNNRPATASVMRTYTSGPTQTENWTYYY